MLVVLGILCHARAIAQPSAHTWQNLAVLIIDYKLIISNNRCLYAFVLTCCFAVSKAPGLRKYQRKSDRSCNLAACLQYAR